MRIFGAVFWAVILIVIGVVIILNQTFDWHISVFAIVIGIILIFSGIAIITRPANTGINGVFANGEIKSIKSGENSYVFSNVILDLNDIADDNIEINCIFSSVKLHTSGKSVKIKANGVFSNTAFPDGSNLAFGDRTYERDGANTVNIETNCVFGSLIID